MAYNIVRGMDKIRSGVDPEEGAGSPDTLTNPKNIGLLSNTGLDPLKITKLPSQHRHASQTPF